MFKILLLLVLIVFSSCSSYRSGIDAYMKKEKHDTIMHFNKASGALQLSLPGIKTFYKNHQLIRLEVDSLLFKSSGTRTTYYFRNEQLVFVKEIYTNRSRIGSCGEVNFEHQYYFRNTELLTTITKDPPPFYFSCYGQQLAEKSGTEILNQLAGIRNKFSIAGRIE